MRLAVLSTLLDYEKVEISEVAAAVGAMTQATGRSAESVVPPQITAPETLRAVLEIGGAIPSLTALPGAERFLDTIVPSQLESTRTVAAIAGLFHDHVESPSLDPYPLSQKHPDYGFSIAGIRIVCECKCVTVPMEQFARLHSAVAEGFAERPPFPGVVLISLKSSESLDVTAMVAHVIPKLSEISTRKDTKSEYETVYDDGTVLVRAYADGSLVNPAHFARIPYLDHEQNSGIVTPMHQFGLRSWRIGVSGPIVNARKLLKGQLKRASKQVGGDPFVLCIDAAGLLGAPADVESFLKGEFTASQNTRIGGVLFLESAQQMGATERVSFFRNNNAALPVPDDFDRVVLAANSAHPRPKRHFGPGDHVVIDMAGVKWVETEV